MTVNERIKIIRKHFEMNQTEFGRKLGVDQTIISKIENGDYKYVASEIMMLLHIEFKININWLLTGKGEMLLQEGEEGLTKDARELCEKLEIENKELKGKIKEYQDYILEQVMKTKPSEIEALHNKINYLEEEVTKYKTKLNESQD